MPAFPGGTPTAADLDEAVPGRAVFLPNRDHHGAWVSSRALEIAGVDAGTPDPPDGRIERDADGRPSGTLHEGATALVSRHLPRTTGDDYYAALLAGQSYLHSLGVTSWQDAIVGAYSGMDDPASTYTTAAGNGDLRSHVVGALWWERRLGVEQVADLVGRREAMTGGPLPGHDREDHAGRRRRERHGRDDRAVPRPVRAPDRQHRALVRRGRRAARGGRGARRRRLPGPRARHRRPRGARGARRVRGHRPRPASPRRPPAAGAPRRRRTVRRARRRGQHAGAVGLPRRPDARADHPVPGGGARRAGSTPSATCTARAPGWSRAATGRSARPTRSPRSTSRSTAPRGARRVRRAPSPSCPSRRSRSRPRSRRTPRGRRGPTTATCTTVPAGSRRVPWRTSWCSTATRSPVRRARSGRPGPCPPGSQGVPVFEA